jgi:hypothetical protein
MAAELLAGLLRINLCIRVGMPLTINGPRTPTLAVTRSGKAVPLSPGTV